jgi:dCMP deaminase
MTMMSPNTVVVAYVPSPHRGYVEFFKAYRGATRYVLGKEIISEFQPLVRNLPANDPEDVVRMIESLDIFSEVRILLPSSVEDIRKASHIVMPDEEVSRALAERHFSDLSVSLDGSWRLRWHWDAVHAKQVLEDTRVVSVAELDQELMGTAFKVASRSSDWWRQVGALLVKDGRVALGSFNEHYPSEQSPYLEGDPRSNFGPGERIEVSSALHAEIGVIAEAAHWGISTSACDLYVTTFPCPPCANAVAKSGIRRLFYVEGYSLISGGDALRSRGVEIIRVDMTAPSP